MRAKFIGQTDRFLTFHVEVDNEREILQLVKLGAVQHIEDNLYAVGIEKSKMDKLQKDRNAIWLHLKVAMPDSITATDELLRVAKMAVEIHDLLRRYRRAFVQLMEKVVSSGKVIVEIPPREVERYRKIAPVIKRDNTWVVDATPCLLKILDILRRAKSD